MRSKQGLEKKCWYKFNSFIFTCTLITRYCNAAYKLLSIIKVHFVWKICPPRTFSKLRRLETVNIPQEKWSDSYSKSVNLFYVWQSIKLLCKESFMLFYSLYKHVGFILFLYFRSCTAKRKIQDTVIFSCSWKRFFIAA